MLPWGPSQAGLFSAVTSAFIIDIQSELGPDYEQMNNVLLEMLLNATTGALHPNCAASIPRWSGPDPAVVQAQCIFYATLSATLLAAFLAMLGKQWLSQYKQNETRGPVADRSRLRERKLTGLRTWKFHIIMESLPLILQCALVLLGFALSRYLWGVNRSISSVVISFTCFGFLFYTFIATASLLSFDCPFQTPFSLLAHSAIGLATPYWRDLRQAFGLLRRPPQPGMARLESLSVNAADGVGHELNADSIPLMVRPSLVAPLFIQEQRLEGDRLDARCIDCLFEISTDVDVVITTMDFIPEVVWHSGIKNVPLKRIYDTLVDCFDFSGPHPVVIPKLRDIAYLSAKAFIHIDLQRCCITRYQEHEQDSWKTLCANHRPLWDADYASDDDLVTVLFMVDMILGHADRFHWERSQMTPPHHGWMSHVFLYCAWDEEQVPEVVVDFVEYSMSLETSPSNIVIADCFFIIGLMIGVPFNVSDITVRDKS